jgi:predicted nucleotidyltransferase
MQEIKLAEKLKKSIVCFADNLKNLYAEELVSVILYGSAASEEFVDKHSNLNFLIVLKNTDLPVLKKAADLTRKFPLFEPLFLTESYINSSTDIFPIEFLDMLENYNLIYGRDVLKDIRVDTKNLRFQCEHELKVKLIGLRQLFLKFNKNSRILERALFKSFNSTLHISRNILRLTGKTAPYKKSEIVNGLALNFGLEKGVWQKILNAKNKQIKLNKAELEDLFIRFTKELEKVVDIADKL